MNIYLKRASMEHCDLLFQWANDEEIRNNSFNKDKISYETHVNWFRGKLKLDSSLIFICYKDSEPIGQIRVDRDKNSALLSYSLDKEFRGQGLAAIMVSKLEELIIRDLANIDVLIACVKFENIPSQKIFKRLNYLEQSKKEYLEYTKHLK